MEETRARVGDVVKKIRHGNESLCGGKLHSSRKRWNDIHTYSEARSREQRPQKAQSLVAVALGSGLNTYQAQGPRCDSWLKQGHEEQMGWEQAKLAATKIQAK